MRSSPETTGVREARPRGLNAESPQSWSGVHWAWNAAQLHTLRLSQPQSLPRVSRAWAPVSPGVVPTKSETRPVDVTVRP